MVDHLVMLLSSDWFRPHWSTIGLEVDSQRVPTLQLGCREIVSGFLSGAREYWHVSFSKERIQQTRARLLALAEKNHLPKDTIDNIEPLGVEESVGRTTHAENGRAYFALTQKLLTSESSTESSHLDPATTALIRTAFAKYESVNIDFAVLCLDSKSEWDRYLRGLTPNQPTFLADYLVSDVLATRSFKLFWSSLKRKLRPEQMNSLVSWYRTTAKSVIGQDLDLPA